MPNQSKIAEKDEKKETNVQPTLFIGIGGTGMEVALRVRRRILNYVWGDRDNPVRIGSLTDFPLAQFINFDLDTSSNTETGKAASTDPLSNLVKFRDEEKLILPLDIDKYMRTEGDLNRFPCIASWFPLSRKKLLDLGIDVHRGAGQIRALSRLYFFDKYLDLKGKIEGKIRALLTDVTSESKTKRLGLKVEPASLRVVVIASTAGGTGSGSFIDMGYLSTWLAKKQLSKAQVYLCLMLPGGYSGHGKSRTEANTYAALMELETCMGHGLEFVSKWMDSEGPELPNRPPYDEIFLFDTGNLALKKTSKATDLFDMVADILFEDFTSEEFANRKRSTAANQNLYKLGSFSPELDPTKYGKMRIMYSKTYSAFGQSIIDTQLEQRRDEIACKQVNAMLKVFFGIASDSDGGREVPPPTPDDARDLLKECAYCGLETFTIAYDFISDAMPYKKGDERAIPKLVSQLLYEGDKPMLSHLHDRINREIDDILASTEKDNRLPRVNKLLAELDRDLGIEGRATDAGARGLEEAIRARRKVMLKNLIDPNSGLLKALWAAIDNKEKGGLDYTIQLIERIKDAIDNDATGLIADMKTAEKWFSDLCVKLRGAEFEVLREHLAQTKGKGLFLGLGRKNKEAYAEAKLQQMGEAIRWYVEAHLRAVACREAAVLLKDLSLWLGEHKGLDEKTNRKRWSAKSFAGELAAYERLVLEIMSDMDEEVIRTQEATKQEHATYQIVTTSADDLDAARSIGPKEAMEWAKSVFDNLGGSRAIFHKLEDEVERADLIGQLRNLALNKLPALETGEKNPLFKALDEMSRYERKDLFQHCLDMAMPWVEANMEGIWKVNPDQYSCFVGVSGADTFEDKFGDEFRSCISGRTGMQSEKIEFTETGVPGKLTCYVELSGIPLTALNMLSNWRYSYNEEGKKIPVHIHRDKTLFVHPMALSTKAFDRLAEHFKLYIQGIILGVLKLRVDNPEERLYCLTVSGEGLSIGNERSIRMEGMTPEHQTFLRKKVGERLDRVKTPIQYAGLTTLYDFYEKCVYSPRKVIDENKKEKLEEGFCNVMCSALKEESMQILKRKSAAAGISATDLITRLRGDNPPDEWENFETLDIWTDEIEGSETDVYKIEVGEFHKAKRILKPEFFKASWLENQFNLGIKRPAEPAAIWWAAINGQKDGPHNEEELKGLIAGGNLTINTKVWKKGMPGWTPVNQVEELSRLFDQPPPLDDEPPDID